MFLIHDARSLCLRRWNCAYIIVISGFLRSQTFHIALVLVGSSFQSETPHVCRCIRSKTKSRVTSCAATFLCANTAAVLYCTRLWSPQKKASPVRRPWISVPNRANRSKSNHSPAAETRCGWSRCGIGSFALSVESRLVPIVTLFKREHPY